MSARFYTFFQFFGNDLFFYFFSILIEYFITDFALSVFYYETLY